MSVHNFSELFIHSLIATAAVEAVTVFMRYGVGLESTRDTAHLVGRLTGGIRIHHGYIGILLLVVAFVLLYDKPHLFRWVFVAGFALAASDLIHHFLVLWPIEGSPQFDFVYPVRGDS